ncbi:hypothetical protein TrRE_jg360, partial [Triparma retinervis]
PTFSPTDLTVASIAYDKGSATLHYTGTCKAQNPSSTRMAFAGSINSELSPFTNSFQVLNPPALRGWTVDARGIAVTRAGLVVLAGCNPERDAGYEGTPGTSRCNENADPPEVCNWRECLIYFSASLLDSSPYVRTIKPSSDNADVLPSSIAPSSHTVSGREFIYVAVNTAGSYGNGPSLLPRAATAGGGGGGVGAVVQKIGTQERPGFTGEEGTEAGEGEDAIVIGGDYGDTNAEYVNVNKKIVKGEQEREELDVYVTGNSNGWVDSSPFSFNPGNLPQGFIGRFSGVSLSGSSYGSVVRQFPGNGFPGNGVTSVVGYALTRDTTIRDIEDAKEGTMKVVAYGDTTGTMDYPGCKSSGKKDIFFLVMNEPDLVVDTFGRSNTCTQLGGSGNDSGAKGGIFGQTNNGEVRIV